MSWRELERLVQDAESSAPLRTVLRRCRARAELVRVARRHGYRITENDLQRALEQHRGEGADARTALRTRRMAVPG